MKPTHPLYGFLNSKAGKTILIATGTILVAGLTYLIFKSQIQKAIDKFRMKKASQKELKEYEDELKKLGKPTLSDADLERLADRLRQAFHGCGTKNKSILSVFGQMGNKSDVLKLITTYGVRKYDACNWEFEFGDDELTLQEALYSENADIGDINAILSRKNIEFQF